MLFVRIYFILGLGDFMKRGNPVAAIKYFVKPEVKFCLVVNENLYELWSADRKIKKDSVHLDDEIPWLPNSLTLAKLVVKILWYLAETLTNQSKSANTNDALKEAIEILENSDSNVDTKIFGSKRVVCAFLTHSVRNTGFGINNIATRSC